MMKSLFCILIFLLIATSVSGESPVSCTSDNVACEGHNDNFLDTIGGLATIEECRQLCYDNEDCQFITYYGQESFPFQELCYLLKSCEETHACDDCVSETRACHQLCGSNVVGVIDENLWIHTWMLKRNINARISADRQPTVPTTPTSLKMTLTPNCAFN